MPAKWELGNIPFSLFHFKRKFRSFNKESCSYSRSDWIRTTNKDSSVDDISGIYCKERFFWATNSRFTSSTIGSLLPACRWWHVNNERIASDSSTPKSWASVTSCEREKITINSKLWQTSSMQNYNSSMSTKKTNFHNAQMRQQIMLMLHWEAYQSGSNQVSQNDRICINYGFQKIIWVLKLLHIIKKLELIAMSLHWSMNQLNLLSMLQLNQSVKQRESIAPSE